MVSLVVVNYRRKKMKKYSEKTVTDARAVIEVIQKVFLLKRFIR